jgi:hypothetical protein
MRQLVPAELEPEPSAKRRRTPGSQVALDRLAALTEPDHGTRVVYTGGGPRTTTQVAAEIQFLDDHADDFRRIQEAGGRYDIQSVIVERKDESFIGRGNAWGPDQGGGTVNTGAEAAGIDYTDRLESFVSDNRDALEHAYRDNPVAASTLRSAFSGNDAPGDGRPTTGRGVLTRQHQGFEEMKHFIGLTRSAQQRHPFYHLTVLPCTSAQAIDLSRPDKPAIALSDGSTNRSLGTIHADVVRLNTGTTTVSPVADPEVLAHSFVQAMEPAALNGFLGARGLLDETGQLKPGSRLALGGTGLSAYDQMIALQGPMNLLERDDSSPSGYRVTESAARKYRGAITFISNTEGKWVPPRHTTSKGPAWTQREDALGNTRELHAGFLHNQGEKVLTDWDDVMRGSIALALGTTPEQVDPRGLDTADLLAAQHERNLTHMGRLDEAAALAGDARQQKIDEAAQTLEGARRQASLQAIIGLGMERDLGSAVEAMELDAPHTFSGRAGYPMHRAQVAGLTQMAGGTPPDNAGLLSTHGAWMSDITSSPVRVHEMASMLFRAGIASHLPGSYSGFSAVRQASGQASSSQDGDKPLQFRGRDGSTARFDAFIVSPTFRRNAEPAIASLAGQVKAVHPGIPDLGEVTTNRRIVAADGQPSHVEDYSLNGKGDYVPGTRSRVGAFALDVNNRESATDVAPGLACRRMAAEHLAAVGVANPIAVVESLYAKHLPDHSEFDAEVRRFELHYESLSTKASYLRAAADAAQGDAGSFAQLAQAARSGSRVQSQAALLEPVLQPYFASVQGTAVDAAVQAGARRFAAPSAGFADSVTQRESFSPASRDRYLSRFVDVPLSVHEAVYQEAFERALAITPARNN